MNFHQATGGEDVVQGRWLLVYDVLGSFYDPLPYVRTLLIERR